MHSNALDDANAAIDHLSALESPPPQPPPTHPTHDDDIDTINRAANAYHRKAQAQIASNHLVDALKTYKTALAVCHGTDSLRAATALALDLAPPQWFAAYWSTLVDAAQQPHPLSSRDGKLLKLVPQQHRLQQADLCAALHRAFSTPCSPWLEEAKDLTCTMWDRDRQGPKRGEVALFRALAYLHHQQSQHDADQADKDAWVAVAYGPKEWAAPLYALSCALEVKGNNVPALLHAAKASELAPEWTECHEAVERLSRRVPDHYAEAIRFGGFQRLQTVLDIEKERSLPPFMRPKPKYYYYYEWMRKRIEDRHPGLPEAIMDKLLTLEADELQLLMQYPAAIDDTVQALKETMEQRGEAALATWAIPLLTWEKKQQLEEEEEQRQKLSLLQLGRGGGGGSGGEARALPTVMEGEEEEHDGGSSTKSDSIHEEEEDENEEDPDEE